MGDYQRLPRGQVMEADELVKLSPHEMREPTLCSSMMEPSKGQAFVTHPNNTTEHWSSFGGGY